MNVLFESPLGGLLARPWLDAAGLFGLRRYMPLSRLWAAANTAKGDMATFRDQAGGLRPSGRPSSCGLCWRTTAA
jgi:hypothetical protein